VEPGNIFKTKDGTKMTEEILEVTEEVLGYIVTEDGIEEVTIA
jgi:hypothetical protein